MPRLIVLLFLSALTLVGKYERIETSAERWDVNPRTIRRMIGRGEITAYHVGKKRLLRVDPDEVDTAMTPIPTVEAS